MVTEYKTIIFLQFPDEAEVLLGRRPLDVDPASRLIALNPATQAYLKRRGYEAANTLSYLTPASRERAWKRSALITQWVREHFDFQDSWGVRVDYVENLVWYTRWLTNYLLWSLEILDNAVSVHAATALEACIPNKPDASGPLTGNKERHFGTMAKDIAAARGVRFRAIPIQVGPSLRGRARRTLRSLGTVIAPNPLVARLHRRQLARMGSKSLVLFTNQAYRMNVLAGRIQQERDALPVLLTDWGTRQSFGWPVTMEVIPPFVAEARLSLLEPLAREDRGSRRRLEDGVDTFTREVSQAPDVFSHLGVSFADIVAGKVRRGIGPTLAGLHRRAATLRMVLETLNPSLVFSNGSRLDDMITGELCRAARIPSMMITHGSHTAPSNDAEVYELGEHGRRLINAPYGFTALQSPLADEFRTVFPSDSEGLRTGPLIWAIGADLERSARLQDQMLGEATADKIVVHAGTPKAEHDGMRFQVYETQDEYVQGIRDLVSAIEQVPGVRLIVKFRPTAELSVEDLSTLVDFSEKSILSVDESLLDVMGFTDLLVSFSSTVIEEALQNRVPVLLYGGDGRYQHIKAPSVTEGDTPGTSALYHVRDAKDLPYALEKILSVLSKEPPGEEQFQPYVYRSEQIVQLPDVIQLMGEHMRVAPRKG